MTEDWINSYIKAGKAVITAKKIARKITKPGITMLEIANKCEQAIINAGCELSFPANVSLNEIAAHYSPIIDDPIKVPNEGLLKIDLGAHHNGYIADSAITINLNAADNYQKYIDAATAGLEAAINIFKPGTKLYELGEVIAKNINSHGLKPIKNLGGHELKRYNLHAGPFIPNYKDTVHNEVLKPGDAYACEPFSTSGDGRVVNGRESYIFRLVRKAKKNMSYEDKNTINKIEKLTNQLPFSPRLLLEIFPKNSIMKIVNQLLRKKILDNYSILIELARAPVAQVEHTIIIDMDGRAIVTTRE